jgi:hypothetical protein
MKLRMSICRKEGRPDYGSDAVGMDLECELPDQALTDVNLVRATAECAYDQLRRLVDEQLAALRPADRQAAPPPERRREPDRDRGGRSTVPEDGRQLLGWAKRNRRDRDVQEIGRQMRLPSRILEWTREECEDVYNVLTEDTHQRNGAAAY